VALRIVRSRSSSLRIRNFYLYFRSSSTRIQLCVARHKLFSSAPWYASGRVLQIVSGCVSLFLSQNNDFLFFYLALRSCVSDVPFRQQSDIGLHDCWLKELWRHLYNYATSVLGCKQLLLYGAVRNEQVWINANEPDLYRKVPVRDFYGFPQSL